MTTKFKLIIIFLFTVIACKAQYNWMQLTPANANDSLINVYSMAFDTANYPYMYGDNYSLDSALLFHFNGNSWDYFYDPTISFGKMIFDKNNILWTLVNNNILGYFNAVGNNVIKVPLDPLLSGHNPGYLAVDNNNNKWVITSKYPGINSLSKYVCRYDGSNWTVFDSTITGIVTSSVWPFVVPTKLLAANNSTTLYVVDSTGYVVKYNGTSWSKLDSTNSNLPSDITFIDATIDTSDILWILASSPVADNLLISYDGIQFYYYYPPISLQNIGYWLRGITADSTNGIWIVNSQEGLIKFDGVNWIDYNSLQQAGILTPDYGLPFIDRKGNIWIGNTDGWTSAPVSIFSENGFQIIEGTVYNDVNANGIHDASEKGIPYQLVKSSEGIYTLTDSAGNFGLYFTDSSNTISVIHSVLKYRYISTSPSSYSINPLTQSTTGKDFGVAELPNITDLSVFSDMFPTRPGFDSYGGIDYQNVGTTAVSDTITLQLDANYSFLNSNPVPDIINGNKLQWLYYNLAPLASGHISLTLHVSPSVNIGDTLFSVVSINPIITDSVPGDNVKYISKVVTGSFDPNEKAVEPKGTGAAGNIPNGETLNYTIHFQNTGTDTAFTVAIQDTLNSKLDINTFQLVGSSHPVVTEINGPGNLKFTFYNILLPDSTTNEPLSHGYVSYKINAIDNLPLGSEIKNTAYIYFDFNAPIVTNTTLNTIANPTGIAFLKNDYSVNVFPSPIHDVSTLQINGVNLKANLSLKLYNLMGQEINATISKITNNRFVIQRSDLASGLYFYKVYDESAFISSGKITVH